jgi:uncharacterized protein involved in exopolysaccharide biosynthesis
MTNSPSANLGLVDLLHIIQRHRRKSLVTFFLLFALFLVALYVVPRTYESEALLFVRVGRESVTLDPTVTTGQTLSLNESRQSELNSILEVLQSRALMEKVVDRLGTEVILVGPADATSDSNSMRLGERILSGLGSVIHGLGDALEPGAPISPREEAVQTLLKRSRISNAGNSNVISIAYRARSPRQAQIVANEISQAYLQEHQRINATKGSYEFFVSQAGLFSDKLDSSIEALRAAKNDMELVSIEGKRQLIESKIQTQAAEEQKTQSALAASDARILELKRLSAGLPQTVNAQQVAGMPNLAGDQMRQQLFQLEIQEMELLSKFTEKHPLVIAVREQLKNARRIQEEQAPSRVQTTTALNPSLQKLEEELLVERAASKSLKAQLIDLDKQHELALAELQEVNTQEQRIEKLQREVELAQINYRTYAEKLEEARIQQSLDEQQISNVNVAQPATFVEKPVSPKNAFVLIAGLLIACLGALFVAIRAEQNDVRMRSDEEVEVQLGMPVVVSIPVVTRNHVLVN